MVRQLELGGSMELEMQPEAGAPAWSLVRLAGDLTYACALA